MDVIFGIIVLIYAFFRSNGITFGGVVSFVVIFLLTWFIVSSLTIKMFKVNKYKFLVFVPFFILNLYNADIYFECAKKISHKFSISKSKTKETLVIFEQKYPDDNFYTISPMTKSDYEMYYGSFYSEKLKKLKFGDYFNACIERGELDENYSFGNYKASFVEAERNIFLEEKLNSILGNKIKVRFRADSSITIEKILKNATKKNSDETIEIWSFSVYVFLDENETKEDYQGKLSEVSKYLFENLKLSGYDFSVDYVDSCYLNDYKSARNLIYFPQQNDKNGIRILEKLKKKEKITDEEKAYLIKLFGPFSSIPVTSSDILKNKISDKK